MTQEQKIKTLEERVEELERIVARLVKRDQASADFTRTF